MKQTLCRVIVGLLAPLALSHAMAGSEADRQADRLRAAYVFNFLKFVEWPAEETGAKDAPLRFAVLGDDPIADAIGTALEGKTVQGRPVSVISFSTVSAWKSATAGCQALFVTAAMWPHWREIRSAISNQPVLTIADSSGFCAAGGMLNMFEQDNRLRFEANLSAESLAGLKMRSELLKLATLVKTEEPPP